MEPEHAPSTPSGEAARAIDAQSDGLARCSFCQEKPHGVMITAPSGAIICETCVADAYHQIKARKANGHAPA